MSVDAAMREPSVRVVFLLQRHLHRFGSREDNVDWCSSCGHSELAHDEPTLFCGVCNASPAGVAA